MLEKVFDRVASLRVAELPVGKALLWLTTVGTAKGISDIVASRWPSIAKYAGVLTGAGLGLVCKKIGPVRRFLGETGAEAFALGGMASAITSLYDVEGKLQSFIAAKGGAAVTPSAVTPPKPETLEVTAGPEIGSPEEVYVSDVARRLAAIRRAQLERLGM
mgnify:CR=1 FL=1